MDSGQCEMPGPRVIILLETWLKSKATSKDGKPIVSSKIKSNQEVSVRREATLISEFKELTDRWWGSRKMSTKIWGDNQWNNWYQTFKTLASYSLFCACHSHSINPTTLPYPLPSNILTQFWYWGHCKRKWILTERPDCTHPKLIKVSIHNMRPPSPASWCDAIWSA